MARMIAMMLLGLTLGAGAASAAEADGPACKTAEVNPVTGHVFCIDPLGAPVEAAPSSMKPKCEEDSRGQWTWAPNCEPAIDGAQG